MKLAVQLYTLRRQIQDGDLMEILEQVKKAGFEGVEFAGFYGYSPEEIKRKLDELSLTAVGAHMGLDAFREENLENTLRTAKILGMKTVGTGGADTDTENNLLKVIDIMGKAAEKAEKEGIKVYFHNHTWEFRRPLFYTAPGTIFDRLKKAVYMQIDTYWSFFAGQENYSLITENRDRIVHLHIKDGLDGVPKALGEGNNDLEAVVKAAKDTGIEWLILENDDPVPDGISDIKRSMKWLEANVKKEA